MEIVMNENEDQTTETSRRQLEARRRVREGEVRRVIFCQYSLILMK